MDDLAATAQLLLPVRAEPAEFIEKQAAIRTLDRKVRVPSDQADILGKHAGQARSWRLKPC